MEPSQAVQARSVEDVGAVDWYLPTGQTLSGVQDERRWFVADWYVLASHAPHTVSEDVVAETVTF